MQMSQKREGQEPFPFFCEQSGICVYQLEIGCAADALVDLDEAVLGGLDFTGIWADHHTEKCAACLVEQGFPITGNHGQVLLFHRFLLLASPQNLWVVSA